jgi:cysteinyl-tRNA synthetase
MPTHDAAGEPLSKGAIKKLAKDYAKQKALYEKHNQQ